jgi:hypothetical protein
MQIVDLLLENNVQILLMTFLIYFIGITFFTRRFTGGFKNCAIYLGLEILISKPVFDYIYFSLFYSHLNYETFIFPSVFRYFFICMLILFIYELFVFVCEIIIVLIILQINMPSKPNFEYIDQENGSSIIEVISKVQDQVEEVISSEFLKVSESIDGSKSQDDTTIEVVNESKDQVAIDDTVKESIVVDQDISQVPAETSPVDIQIIDNESTVIAKSDAITN